MRPWIKWLERRSQVQMSVLGTLLVAGLVVLKLHGLERLANTPIFLLLTGAVAWFGGFAPAAITAAAAASYLCEEAWTSTLGQPVQWFVWGNVMLRFASCLGVGWVVAAWRRVNAELEERVSLRTAELQKLVRDYERTEAELRVSREQLAELAENIDEVFWVTDAQKSRMIYVSSGYERIWGQSCESLYRTPRSWLDAIHPADCERVRASSLNDQIPGHYDEQYRIVRPDGTVRWIRDRAFPIRDAQGQAVRLVGLAEDISEQRQAREKLQTQARVLEHMSEGVALVGRDFRIRYTNPAFDTMMGSAPGELLGQPLGIRSGLSPEATRHRTQEIAAQVQASGHWTGEFHHWRKPGGDLITSAHISSLLLNGEAHFVLVCQDITERRRMEQTLRESEERYRALAEASPDSISVVTCDGRYEYANPVHARWVGHSAEALKGRRLADFWPDPVVAKLLADLQQAWQAGKPVAREQLSLLHPERWVELRWLPLPRAEGAVPAVLAIVRDITERKQAEEEIRRLHESLERRVQERTAELQAANAALRDSELRNAALLNATDQPMLLMDLEGIILAANTAMGQRFGRRPAELVGVDLHRLMPPDLDRRRRARAEAVIRTGQPVRFQDERAGIAMDNFIYPVVNEQGQVTALSVFSMDITARKRMEDALRMANERLELAQRAAGAGAWDWNITTGHIEWSPRLFELFGLDPQRAPASFEAWRSILHGEDREEAAARIEEALKERRGLVSEYRIVHPDGQERWISALGEGVYDAQGQPTRMTGICIDITERKRIEETLRAAEQRMRFQLAETPALLYSGELDMPPRAVFVSDNVRTLLGYEPTDVTGDPGFWLRQVHPEDMPHVETSLATVLRQGANVWEYRLRDKAGHYHWLRDHLRLIRHPDGRPAELLGCAIDITERKQVEEALQKSEAKYRRLHESVSDATVTVDMQGRIQEFNRAYREMLGYSETELVQLTYEDLTPEAWHAAEARIVAEQILPRGSSAVYEKEYRRKDGTVFPVELRTFLLRDDAGQPAGMWAFVRDITERKRAEQEIRHLNENLEQRVRERTAELEVANAALRKSEAIFRAVTDCCPEPIYLKDRQSRMVFANPATLAALGVSAEALLEKPVPADFEDPAIGQAIVDTDQRLMAADKTEVLEETILGARGRRIYLSSKAPYHDEAGNVIGLVGVSRDITERKEAEESLRHSEANLRGILNATQESVCLFSPDGIVLLGNLTSAERFGLRTEEFTGRHFSEFLPAELTRSRSVHLKAAVASARPVRFEDERSGIQFETTLYPVLDASGRVTAVASFSQDVTARKEAEHLLEAQRELAVALGRADTLEVALASLLAALTHLPGLDCGGIYLVDRHTGALDLAAHHGLSAEFVSQVTHYPADSEHAAIGQSLLPLYSAVADLPPAISRRCAKEGLRMLAAVPLRDAGRVAAVLNLASRSVAQLPLPIHLALENIAAQAEGVIARLRAEAAQRESDHRLRSIIQGAPIALFAADQNGNLTFSDGRQLRAWAIAPHADIGRPLAESALVRQFPILLEHGGRALTGEEFTELVPLGPGFFECSYSPYKDAAGAIAGFIGVATNVSERVRLERQILEISEYEQARMGQDIHDDLCQQLVSIAFDINSLEQALAYASRPQAAQARRIAEFVDAALTRSRQLARGLFPVKLEAEGLSSALQELAASTTARHGLSCSFEHSGSVLLTHNVLAIHLFRIAQEAVRNALRHAQARHIRIRLARTGQQLALSVADDGRGLPPGADRATGLGRHIMEYRARTLQGTFRIGANPDGGTVVSCCVPVPPE